MDLEDQIKAAAQFFLQLNRAKRPKIAKLVYDRGLPITRLRRRITGIPYHKDAKSGKRALNDSEEAALLRFVRFRSEVGCPLRKRDLHTAIREILKQSDSYISRVARKSDKNLRGITVW